MVIQHCGSNKHNCSGGKWLTQHSFKEVVKVADGQFCKPTLLSFILLNSILDVALMRLPPFITERSSTHGKVMFYAVCQWASLIVNAVGTFISSPL